MEDGAPAARDEFVASPFGPTAVGRNDAVALGREDLKLLASDTRLDILKALRTRRMTVSELASTLALGKSTVFEHLNKLVEGGLVLRHDDANREWVYYELAPKSRRLFAPVSAKIVLMLSSVVGLALAALVAWSIASMAAGGLHVEVGPDSALAGEPTWLYPKATTSGGDPVADVAWWIMGKAEYDAFRGGAAPDGRLVEPDALGRIRVALPAGDHHVAAVAPDGTASLDGSGRIHVTPARLHVDPSPILVGADDARAVRLWVTHEGRVLDGGTLLLEGDVASFGGGRSVLALDGPLAETAIVPAQSGAASVSFRPEGPGAFFAPLDGQVRVDVPSVRIAPEFIVLGEDARLTVTVWHDERGPVADAPVRVVLDGRTWKAATDAHGVAHLPALASEAPADAVIYVGSYEAGRVPVVRQMRVQTAVTSLGLEIWAQDLETGRAVVGALVEQNGAQVATTTVDGHALVESEGPVVLRAKGYAPYGLGVPGYAADAVHWVSLEEAPATVGAAPKVAITELEVAASPVRVPPGGVVHVTARLRNPSDRPVVETAILVVDGTRWSAQDVPLAPGETRVVEFPVLLRDEGVHRLSVNRATALEILVQDAPAPRAATASAGEAKAVPWPWAAGVAAVTLAALAPRRR